METMNELNAVKTIIAKASEKAGSKKVPELVAVSKTQPVGAILNLREQGQMIFGENYVQELLEKKAELDAQGVTDIDFHFIGHLQSNKAKSILPHVSTIHSVDSLRLYEEIAKRSELLKKKMAIYFQVNIDRETSKGGFKPEDLLDLHYQIKSKPNPWVIFKGLMTIPDPQFDPARAFKEMKKLSTQYGDILGAGLSMGMSKDFESAIAYGATSLRVGTALFGLRD
jgi:pyridoxal phosphate enzyme (YggS family)